MSPKNDSRPIAAALAALAAAAVLAGCGGTPTRYYTLAEGGGAPPAAQRGGADTARFAIEMAPLAVPERLARPQMVVRRTGLLQSRDASQAEVDVLEQSRWVSSFEFELRDALSSGIATRLGAFDATKAGRPAGVPVYRISVQLRQFDAVPGTRVDSDFGWSVRRADSDLAVACQMQLSEPVTGGVEGVALGAQRITARLADEISRNVSSLAANQPARCPAAVASAG